MSPLCSGLALTLWRLGESLSLLTNRQIKGSYVMHGRTASYSAPLRQVAVNPMPFLHIPVHSRLQAAAVARPAQCPD